MLSNEDLLFIEPKNAAASSALIDSVTRRMAAAFRRGQSVLDSTNPLTEATDTLGRFPCTSGTSSEQLSPVSFGNIGELMQPIQAPITGAEVEDDASSPYLALVHFYRAFNGRDISLMAANWASSDSIAMDNPLGGIRRGWDAIRQVYERLFQGPAQVYVEFWDYTIHESPDMFYAVGRERGYFRSSSADLSLAFRTSRIFSKLDGRWRQVHHHGSIEDPQLLTKYQVAVLGAQPGVA